MFKRGVITDEISQDFKIAVDLAQKFKLDGVEIRSVWERGSHELEAVQIKAIKEILDAAGMQVPSISTPFFKCDIDNEDEILDHMEILRKSINFSHQVGATFIRGFTFWRKGDFEENLEKIVSRFEKPLKILEQENMQMVLEFDPNVFTTNAKKLVKVLQGINSVRVKALWDPGNDIYDPEGEIPFPDGYKIIKPYIAHMHLKDARKLNDGTIIGVPPGEGQVEYMSHFRELIKNSYDGYIMLETHYRPNHPIREELLALPKGTAFSYLGYEATEECLQKWDKLMERLKVPEDRRK